MSIFGNKKLGASGAHRAIAADEVFETGQLFGTDRAARMHLAGGDADFRAHAEFTPVGKLGRGIVHQDRTIELGKKMGGGLCVFGDDRIGVVRPELADMGDGFVHTVDQFGRADHVEKFVPEIIGLRLGCSLDLCQIAIGAHLDPRL